LVIAGLATLFFVPERSTAQQAGTKIPRVGILSVADSERVAIWDAFRQGLRDLGYVEGRNIILEFRLARGNLSLGPQMAAGLVALPVDVIVVEGVTADAVGATDRIPIVSPVMMDPVERVSPPACRGRAGILPASHSCTLSSTASDWTFCALPSRTSP